MGKLFVIEGTDGCGKETQAKRLKAKFDELGIEYKTVSFPNYDSPSSSLVKMYLSGEFGEHANDVNPYIASTFYAADRYATYKKELKEFYDNGGIILADRYTTSNMLFQTAKIKNKEEREKFLNWLWDFEFNLYGLPVPTKTIFLNMPVEFSLELMKKRENKFSHEEKKDIHERDTKYMEDSHNAAKELIQKYDWFEIDCVKENQIKTIEEIHEEIFNELKKYL